jgi:hypothetical protein
MKDIVNKLKELEKFLLLLFPAFYLLTGAYFRTLLGDLSLRSVDPDYVYFSNGLGVAMGSFDTGNIFHPGAPLQYFTALIFRLTYILRSPEVNFLEDVFSHPDLYQSVVSFCVIGLTAMFLFVSGVLIFRITNSILNGLLIQTTTFLPIIWYDLIGRNTQEVFLAFSVLALSIVIIKYYSENKFVNTRSGIFLLALIIAFGLSTKITFLPLVIIPLFIIQGLKNKFIFLFVTLLLFLSISLSILLKIEVFWGWIKNLFLHSGDYGAGDTNVVNIKVFADNLVNFIQLEAWYFKVVGILLITVLLYGIIYRKKADHGILLYSGSLIVTISFHLAIVCKHFAHRNYIPSLLLLPLVVFFSIEILKKVNPSKIIRFFLQVLLIAFLIVTVKNQFIWLPIKSNAMGNDINARKETRNFTSTLEKGSIKIITSQSYGCPFQEYALMYSTAWSKNEMKPQYAEVLGKLYPDTYQHTTWDDRFQYWGEKFDAQKIINSGRKVYLYIERNDEELYNRTLIKIQKESETGFTAERELLFLNAVNNEVIYQLKLSKAEKIQNL